MQFQNDFKFYSLNLRTFAVSGGIYKGCIQWILIFAFFLLFSPTVSVLNSLKILFVCKMTVQLNETWKEFGKYLRFVETTISFVAFWHWFCGFFFQNSKCDIFIQYAVLSIWNKNCWITSKNRRRKIHFIITTKSLCDCLETKMVHFQFSYLL